ncbi:MAG: DUF86 domain-containing protein [Endomicrobiia bacterium]|nr:DUF86 domain-containing protein [Endomicrobiia bacterium]
MNKEDRVKDYLNDIVECCEKIEKYTSGISFDEYRNDSKTIDGVERNIIKIGDAVERIPKEFQEKTGKIPWKDMRDIRIKLTHHYPDIKDEIVWETAKKDIPDLKCRIKEFVSEVAREQEQEKSPKKTRGGGFTL